MPARIILIDAKTGKALHTESYRSYGKDEKILAVTTQQKEHSVFNTETYTETGTVRLASPDGDGSLEITDLIITGEEKALGSVTVQFNDGTASEIVTVGYVATRTLNLHTPFQGKVDSWQGAYLEAVVAGDNFAGSVTVIYIKRNKEVSLPYAEWNARR